MRTLKLIAVSALSLFPLASQAAAQDEQAVARDFAAAIVAEQQATLGDLREIHDRGIAELLVLGERHSSPALIERTGLLIVASIAERSEAGLRRLADIRERGVAALERIGAGRRMIAALERVAASATRTVEWQAAVFADDVTQLVRRLV